MYNLAAFTMTSLSVSLSFSPGGQASATCSKAWRSRGRKLRCNSKSAAISPALLVRTPFAASTSGCFSSPRST